MFCEDSFNPSNIRTQREVTQPLLLDSIRVSTVPQMIILDNRLHWFLLGVSVIVLETTGSTALYRGSMPGTGFTVVIMMVALQNCSPGFYCVSIIPHRTVWLVLCATVKNWFHWFPLSFYNARTGFSGFCSVSTAVHVIILHQIRSVAFYCVEN